MKIIVSPSKTAQYVKHPLFKDQNVLFPKKTKQLVSVIRKFNQNDLGKALHIKGAILKETHFRYKNYYKSEGYHAFPSFDGLVFKQLTVSSYTKEDIEYITKNVRILDALYGVLEPGTLIKPYRLDMKAKLGMSLYSFWDVSSYFEGELIINLASKEFSVMIQHPMITVEFYDKKKGILVSQATYSKMGRGAVLHYMIKNHISSLKELIQFSELGYRHDESISNDHIIAFVREKD